MSRERFGEMRKAFLHRNSLVVVGLLMLMLAFRSPLGMLDWNAQGTAASIFQVSGTMVALALPAGELANHFITRAKDLIPIIIEEMKLRPGEVSSTMDVELDKIRDGLFPALRASVYALVSFLMSGMAMLVPSMEFPLGNSFSFSPDHLLVGSSLGFLLVGGFWFYPTVVYAFTLESIDDMKNAIKLLGDRQRISTSQQPDAKQAPKEDSTSEKPKRKAPPLKKPPKD